MPATHQHHRIVGCHAIQITQVRQPLFLQLRLVPVVVGHQQVARLACLDAGRHCGKQFLHRSHARQIHAGPAARVVQVPVHQARQHRASLEVDAACVCSGKAAHLVVATDGDKFVAADGNRLGNGKLSIDGDDLAVEQDGVRRRRALART